MERTDKVYTVMIIDDCVDDRYLLKRYLEKTELHLVLLEAGSGSEGIELLTTSADKLRSLYPGIQAPVILFLDINMPVMNGWEFIEELERRRHEVELNPTLVLMHSNSSSIDDKNKAKDYEAVISYIVKGESSPEILRQMILSNNIVD